ncbi:DUF7344 domain-containing protein [Halopelagius fulvigenes]|uniref:DUF7344 domain-containing protein n=1 Tax=Halopelagius fulvigenes TaxID=1198324 RepID=A0ABD5TVK5_9EURY
MAVTENRTLPSEVLDEHLALLANDQRRAIVEILAEENRSHQVRLLAGWTAAEERGVPLDALPEEAVERMEVKLHHVHLPKLDEAGIVEYDAEENRVAPGAEMATARRLVESLRSARRN